MLQLWQYSLPGAWKNEEGRREKMNKNRTRGQELQGKIGIGRISITEDEQQKDSDAYGSSHGDGRLNPNDHPDQVDERIKDPHHRVDERIKDADRRVGEPIKDADHRVGERIKDADRRVGDRINDADHRVDERIKDKYHKVDERIKEADRRVDEPIKDADHRVGERIRDADHRVDERIKDTDRTNTDVDFPDDLAIADSTTDAPGSGVTTTALSQANGSSDTRYSLANLNVADGATNGNSDVRNGYSGATNGNSGATNGNLGARNRYSGARNVNSGATNENFGATNVNSGVTNRNSGARDGNSGARNGNSGARKNGNSGARNGNSGARNGVSDNDLITSIAAINNIPVEELGNGAYINRGRETSFCFKVIRSIKNMLTWLFRYLTGPAPVRQKWDNSLDSLMSHVAFTVGLGNMWRFPYYCYKHGGATFLIPYGICLLVIGLPEYFLDISLGQYMSLGPTNVYANMAPLFSGLGWAMVLLAAFVSIYYNVVIAWTILYICSSFTENLPWKHCENDFNTPGCYVDGQNNSYAAAEEFFKRYVLRKDQSSNYELHPELVLSLGLAWLMVVLFLVRGIRSAGKVVYVTVIFPYVVLTLLLGWSYSKFDTSSWEDSFYQYFSPSQVNGSKLLEVNLWADAAVQVLFTLGHVFGGHTTLSSYNTLHQNTLGNSIFIALWDTATSFLCGCVVFTSLSQLAFEMEVKVTDIFSGREVFGVVGVEVVFIAYPALLGRVGAPIWSVLFFLMILALSIDSTIGFVETITTALFDNFKLLQRRYLPVVCLVCLCLFLLGLPMCTTNGVFLVELMHVYTCKVSMLVLGLLKIFVICYVFGFSRLLQIIRKELKVTIPKFIEWYLAVTLMVLSPLSLMSLLLWTALFEDPHQWEGAPLPMEFRILGWLLAIASCLVVPAVALKVLYENRHQDWRKLLKPTADFRPEYLRQDSNEPNLYILRDRDPMTASVAGDHDPYRSIAPPSPIIRRPRDLDQPSSPARRNRCNTF